MCGIAGIFNLDGKNVSQKILHGMDYAIRHRGPDGHGEMIDKFIGLANRRLAIIDLGKTGNQPMSTDGNNFWITFNGEIFNYRQIRDDLLNAGFTFKTQTDTEVVLNAYRYYGENCVSRFIGQFALGVWDKKKETLFLARDQLGVNPLFYALSNKTFLFASEVKAILASHFIKKEINKEALYHYLSVFSIPQPLTIISSIKSLIPGTFMLINKNGIKTKRFWQIPKNQIVHIKSYEEAKSVLRNLLSESVKSAMVADVPVGAFLSGGVDSSSVVALMSRNTRKKIKTYSLWAKGHGEAFDERKYAQVIAKKFQTDHTEFSLSEEDFLKEFKQYIYFLDQPNGESLETYFLSKVIGQDVKVALSGLGGDELFAGYHGMIYQTQYISRFYHYLPSLLKKIFQKLIQIAPFSADFKKTVEISGKFLNILNPFQKRLFLYFVYQDYEKKKLLSPDFLMGNNKFNTTQLLLDIIKTGKNLPSLVDKLAYLDLNSYTRDNLLLTANIASMAHSLEVRVPLLDARLVEFSFSLPSKFKLRNGQSKFIFKDVMREWLPDQILNHKKQGFGLPRIKYMRGKLKPFILESLSPVSVNRRGIFSATEVDNIVRKFYSNPTGKMLWTEHLRVWILFIFELWVREYLD